eukprot:829170-Prymnesium_polylepis.1
MAAAPLARQVAKLEGLNQALTGSLTDLVSDIKRLFEGMGAAPSEGGTAFLDGLDKLKAYIAPTAPWAAASPQPVAVGGTHCSTPA